MEERVPSRSAIGRSELLGGRFALQRRLILSLEALVFPDGTNILVKDEGSLYRQWRGPSDL